MEQTGLKEAGNILASAYLNALSDFMGMMLIPSVPSLVVDSAGPCSPPPTSTSDTSATSSFASKPRSGSREPWSCCSGHFLLLPDMPSLRAIFDAIRLT